MVVGLTLLLNSCSSFNFEKGGTILGSIGGVGSGMYMCESYELGKFKIGCMVLGGLVGGVLGGELGETFDNKEIYDSVRYGSVGDTKVYEKKDEKMTVEITDDYIQSSESTIFKQGRNDWCKDFEFEVENYDGVQRGKGKSCKDSEGIWRTIGIDLLQ